MDVESLDKDTLRELRSLGPVGIRVGRHLLTAAAVVDDDPDEALRQLRAAVQRGSRLHVVRETAGVVGYAAGDFAFALRELRTATRLGVGAHLLPLVVDCERALGHPERALDLAAAGGRGLDADTAVELAIVVSGIHRDLGDRTAALAALEGSAVGAPAARTPAGIRLRYARAAVIAGDDPEAATALFVEVARDDVDGLTDAADRVAEAAGLLFDDLSDDDLTGEEMVGDDRAGEEMVGDDRAGEEMVGDDRADVSPAPDDRDDGELAPGRPGADPVDGVPVDGRPVAVPDPALARAGSHGGAALDMPAGEVTTVTGDPGSGSGSPQGGTDDQHGDEEDAPGAEPG